MTIGRGLPSIVSSALSCLGSDAGRPMVLVNGEVVIDSGDHTGTLPGRVLRRRRAGDCR